MQIRNKLNFKVCVVKSGMTAFVAKNTVLSVLII